MANEKLPEFKGQEQFQPGTQPLPFGDAYRKLAENSNVLGKLGAEVAMSAAQQGAQLAGIKYGKDPKGNIFPAFTKTDEAFTEAYRSTAYATLSVQADELMTNGVTTLLGSDGPLTQEGIDSFAANMLEGINDIAELAPDIDKEQLKTQFASNLMASQGKLQEKLINEEQARMKDEFTAYVTQSNETISNAAVNGEKKLARDEYNTQIGKAKAQFDSGLLSKTQYETAKKTARITLLSGETYGDYLKAKANDKENDFLHKLQSETPNGWTPLEHGYVMQNLAARINSANNLDRQHQQNMLTEAQAQLNSLSGITPELMTKITSEGDDTTKTKLALMLSSDKNRSNTLNSEVQKAVNNMDNFAVLDGLSEKALNGGYNVTWRSLMAANPNLTEAEAKVLAYTSYAKPPTAFIREFNNKAASDNPEDKNEALMQLNQIRNDKPGHLAKLNDDAINALDLYERLGSGSSQIDAAIKANDVIFDNSKQREAERDNNWKNYKSSKKFTKKNADITKIMSDITGQKLKPEQITLAVRLKEMLEQKVRAMGGVVGEESFLKGLGLLGTTNQNGKEEVAWNPLEKSQGATSETMPLWRQQVAEQVMNLVGPGTNNAYDKNTEKQKRGGDHDPNDFTITSVRPLAITEEDRESATQEYKKLVKRIDNYGESDGFYTPDVFNFPAGFTESESERVAELQEILKSPIFQGSRKELDELTAELKPLAEKIERAREIGAQLQVLQEYDTDPEAFELLTKERGELLKGGTRARFDELQRLLRPYQVFTAPRVRIKYRDGRIEDFTLGIYNPNNRGTYNVKLVDGEGRPRSFPGMEDKNGNAIRNVYFTPDRKNFEEKYARFVDISNSGGEGELANVIKGKAEVTEAMESLVEKRKNNVVKDVKDIVSSTAKEVGADEKIAAAIVKAESNFKASAKNPGSSAKGLYQFTRATWNTMVERYGEKYGVSKDDILKPEANAIMGALLTKENSEGLRRSLGREPTSAEVYLAHFAGLGRAIKITKAMTEDPNQPSSKFFTKQQIAANKGVIKKTIGETLKELARRVRSD